MLKRLALLLILIAPHASNNAAQPSPAAEVFTRLKNLVGDWHGTATWTGARTGSYEMRARYSLTAKSTAVIEHLGDLANPDMTTVYHMDGSDLRMTHYCGATNQPRLKATKIDGKKNVVVFSFVDVTNLAKPDAGHVHGLELRFHDKNNITLIFTFVGDGKTSYENIDLKRTAR